MIVDSRRTAFFDVDGTLIDRNDKPIETTVNQLKGRKAAGYCIVVWSVAGPDWAARAVDLLGLRNLVDICMSKPTITFDELPPNLWTNWWDTSRSHIAPEYLTWSRCTLCSNYILPNTRALLELHRKECANAVIYPKSSVELSPGSFGVACNSCHRLIEVGKEADHEAICPVYTG